jgi:hypothetical protein
MVPPTAGDDEGTAELPVAALDLGVTERAGVVGVSVKIFFGLGDKN